jgi:transposase
MFDSYAPELADDERFSRHQAAASCETRPRKDMQQRHQEVIGLLERRMPIREIAAVTGYCLRAVSYIAQRYREAGPAALADRRRSRSRSPRLLTLEQQQDLAHMLGEPPPDGGEWTGPKVAEWIAAKTGRRVHRQRGWEYLRRLRRN